MAELVVAPSILSADFGRLGDEIRAVAEAGADWIHVDVMDGRFVPNITVGPLVVRAARAATRLPLDVHLMIIEPERYLESFVAAGADLVSVHVEVCHHLERTIAAIHDLGAKAGVVLNPHTPEESIRYVLDSVDLVLVMSVNPGFGGQSFLPSALGKLRALRAMIDATGRDIHLEVDGGVSPTTAAEVVAAGARTLVAGSAIFGALRGGPRASVARRARDYGEAITALRRAGRRALGPRKGPSA